MMIGLLGASLVTIGIHIGDVFAPPTRPQLTVWEQGAPPNGKRIEVQGENGAKLRGWIVSASRPNAPYVLFFYGSNEDVLIERNRLVWLSSLGVNAVCFDYRGYGFSEGQIGAAEIRADALRMFDAVRTTIAPAGAAVIVYGWSVGTQLALHVAANRPVSGVILQAPPASADAMDKASRATDVPRIVRWAVSLKSDPAVRSIYQGATEARMVSAPLIILEGSKDTTVPPVQARAVFNASPSKDKRIVFIDGADHNSLQFKKPPASTAVLAFLEGR